MPTTDQLERVVRRLERRVPLDEADRQAVRRLPLTHRTLDPASYMVREGETVVNCSILISGFAYRHKVTGEGERQILSIHMPGEFLDLQNCLLGVADHNVQALTRCEVAFVPVTAIRALTEAHPMVARAMWIDTLIDAAIYREWMVNVGRRDSTSRLAHLLCEIALRLEDAGLSSRGVYELPMTQEQIADCAGLTPVHVNRVLKELGRLGLIQRDKRAVTIVDWDRLRTVGDFSTRYLHRNVGGPNDPESAGGAVPVGTA
ncbi:MAG TPA: Crp/Fnr family transcriptional regulator [Allosphingosinicella sp.]|jgi:CRP-like cAMP-binding protein